MPYRPADPALQVESAELIAFAAHGITPQLRLAANDLALRLRSRLIDLATWQADSSPEYKGIEALCRRLVEIAGADAHPSLIREFGQSIPASQ